MKFRRLKYLSALTMAVILCACQSPEPETTPAETTPPPTFDAAALWANVRADFDLFYAYRDLRGFDADAYMDRVGTLVTSAPDRDEFRRRLHRATYAFTDPHLGYGPRDDADFNVIPSASDLQIGYASGRYRVLDVRAGSAALKAGVRSGWTLVSVEGQSLNEHVTSVFTDLVDVPSEAQRAYAATLAANGRRVGDRTMVFEKPDNSRETLTLVNPRVLGAEVMTRPAIETRRLDAEGGLNIAVLRINNRLGDNDFITAFDTALATVTDADGIILDLRNTPSGGNAEVGRSIMGHFTNTLKPFQIHEKPSLEREFTVPRRFTEQVYPREPFNDPNKTIVLGGYWTGSMGEGIVIGMDAIGVKTIASDMGDLLGGMSNFSFDNGAITLAIPTETLFHVDGTPREDFIANTALLSADSDEDGSDPAIRAALTHFQTR